MDYHIRPAELNDLDQVQNLLTKVDLPLNGVKDQFSNFFILENENSIIGSISLEIYSSYALLRSLAVDPDFQNLKLGSKLLLKIETYANSKKINHIYLLTETAELFFSRHGFQAISRNEVPIEIKKSREFSKVCPESAVVMIKDIN